jgi:hypothetical protein
MTLQRSRETLKSPDEFSKHAKNYDTLPPQGPSRGTAGRVRFSLPWSAAGAPLRGRRHSSLVGGMGASAPIFLIPVPKSGCSGSALPYFSGKVQIMSWGFRKMSGTVAEDFQKSPVKLSNFFKKVWWSYRTFPEKTEARTDCFLSEHSECPAGRSKKSQARLPDFLKKVQQGGSGFYKKVR